MRRLLPAALLALALALAGCGVFNKRPPAPVVAEPPIPEQAPAEVQAPVPAKTPAKPAPAPVPVQRQPAIAMLTPDTYDTARALRLRALTEATGGLGVGDVGYYRDVLDARLRQRLGGRAIAIDRGHRGDIVLRIPGNSLFESNQPQLNPDALELLTVIAQVLDEYRLTLITVHGHTDDDSEATLNLRNSEQRAMAVARALVNAGVAPTRLLVVGHGESEPVADNATPEGRERNRRVELQVEPIMP